jgi:cyclopropane fatty-acyl-phospholipid synthase-like methyltransferase
MTDWSKYWNEAPLLHDPDPLRQVGKTVGGVPIGTEQFEALVDDIRHKLQLGADDTLLDLCCGNGAVTLQLARGCRRVVGVDFSAPLVKVAAERFAAPHVQYLLADVSDLPAAVTRQAFTKVCLYEGLQHLEPAQVESLLAGLRALPAPPTRMLLGSVPDARRIWNFYDTPERRADFERRRLAGNEAIGHWWEQDVLRSLLERFGWHCEVLDQHPMSHGAHYRFDAVCTPAAQGGAS